MTTIKNMLRQSDYFPSLSPRSRSQSSNKQHSLSALAFMVIKLSDYSASSTMCTGRLLDFIFASFDGAHKNRVDKPTFNVFRVENGDTVLRFRFILFFEICQQTNETFGTEHRWGGASAICVTQLLSSRRLCQSF